MQLWKRLSDLTVTRYLRFGKNAVLKVTGSDNSETEISLDELKNALDSGVRSQELTEAITLTAADSGKTLYLNSTTEFATTLPAPAEGLEFEFIVKAAPSSASYTIVSNGSSNIIKGQIYTVDVSSATDPDFEATGGDTITLVDSKAIAGDRVVLRSDGTNWFAYGFCSVFDAITITGT
ncbi:MAG: hypothetical protein KDA17_07665 [Candidatus Saccharibacteria bacterium]|nr:hypothetical protein [Candidatus Saccharibacteria bacterium]